MSKSTTVAIQDQLVSLGKNMGLRAEKEYSFKRQIAYNPRYDVIWFLDVSSLHINELKGMELVDNKWLPLATFEVEGSTTSSKNQVGNVGNIMISPCHYHFMIVINKEAGSEKDTYRRGVKIVRTMQELFGEKNIVFLDASMLPVNIHGKTKILAKEKKQKQRTKGSGGETISLPVAEHIVQLLEKTNLTYNFDFVSPYFKMRFQQMKSSIKDQQFTYDPITFMRKNITSVSQYYYCPKVDISAGFLLSGGFVDFLKVIASNLKDDMNLYPLLRHIIDEKINEFYYPLLGIEIETGNSKHAIGGLMNAGRLHQIGWLVGIETMQHSVETYQHFLGLRNTHYIPINLL